MIMEIAYWLTILFKPIYVNDANTLLRYANYKYK